MSEVPSKSNFSEFVASKTLIASKIKEKDQETYYLKSELKNKINEFNQMKMNLIQKIEFLEKQVQEGKIRENNLRSMNENLTKALEEISSEKKNESSSKDLQNTIEIHTKELLEQKMRNTEIVSLVEEENKTLLEKVEILQIKLAQVNSEFEAKEKNYKKEKEDLEKKIIRLEDMRKKKNNISGEYSKAQEYEKFFEDLKTEHSKEIDIIKKQHQNKITAIKELWEIEKHNYESEIEGNKKQIFMFKNKLSQVNLDRLSSENKNLKAKINEMSKLLEHFQKKEDQMKDLLCDIDSIENYDALRKSSFALPQPKLNKSKSRYGFQAESPDDFYPPHSKVTPVLMSYREPPESLTNLSTIEFNPYNSIENMKFSQINTERLMNRENNEWSEKIKPKNKNFNLEGLIEKYESELLQNEKEKKKVSIHSSKLENELDKIILELKQNKEEVTFSENNNNINDKKGDNKENHGHFFLNLTRNFDKNEKGKRNENKSIKRGKRMKDEPEDGSISCRFNRTICFPKKN